MSENTVEIPLPDKYTAEFLIEIIDIECAKRKWNPWEVEVSFVQDGQLTLQSLFLTHYPGGPPKRHKPSVWDKLFSRKWM